MATIEKTVEVIFAGVDQMTGTLSSIRGGLNQLDSVVQSVADPMAKVADGVLKADAALAALAGAGLAFAFKASMDLEAAMIDLAKVVGDQPAQLAQAKTAALDLSNTYGKSATDIVQSFANFKQAGFDLQDSMTLTRTALDLVIAGEVDMDRASQILVQTLKGFNAPASDAQRVLDVLNSTSNAYATNVELLADAMARSAPIASLMGFSYEELVGVLTPMIEVFQDGEISGRAFNTVLQRLQDDSGPVTDAMKLLGVSQLDLNGQMRSGKDIFYDVATAFQTLDPAMKTFVASQLAGKDQAAKLAAALSDANKITAVTETALRGAGSAAEEVAKRLESAQVAVDRFVVGFANLGAAVGDEFRAPAT